MRLGSSLAGFLLAVVLCSGCATRKPFRSVPAGDRAGTEVIDVTPRAGSSYSTANSRALNEAGAQSGILPAIIMGAAAGTIEGKGLSWVNSIRARGGLDEAEVVAESIRERVRQLNAGNTNGGPILEVAVTEVGIAELQRGGYFGAVGRVHARLRNAANKELWSAEASSSSTRLRRREEYDARPELYSEDFREVAEDIARQLIDGPIR
jgi:hypothetical protein